MTMRLTIVDHTQDHVLVSTDEPMRIEVSLIGRPPRIILHAYRGEQTDVEQEPDLVYDGTEAADMHDMTSVDPHTALLDAYESGGPSAVFAWVEANRPGWGSAPCAPCEDTTPTWPSPGGAVCAVCWTGRPKGA